MQSIIIIKSVLEKLYTDHGFAEHRARYLPVSHHFHVCNCVWTTQQPLLI